MKPTKTAAIVTIKEPGRMSRRGRKQIAAWLRRQAASLEKEGANYGPSRFTARYRYA